MTGLREIILQRNKLGDGFAKNLEKALAYDKYVKVINIAGNEISVKGLAQIVKLSLIDNNSLIAFDARLNPGCTEKAQRQIALCLLKNIEKMRQKGVPIKKEWIRWDLVSVGIPPAILRQLRIRDPKNAHKRRKSTRPKRNVVLD